MPIPSPHHFTAHSIANFGNRWDISAVLIGVLLRLRGGLDGSAMVPCNLESHFFVENFCFNRTKAHPHDENRVARMTISAKELTTLLKGMADGKYNMDKHVLGHAASTIEDLAAALDPFARHYETQLTGAENGSVVTGNLRVGDFKRAALLTGSR